MASVATLGPLSPDALRALPQPRARKGSTSSPCSIHDRLAQMLRQQQYGNARNAASMMLIPVVIRAFGPLPPLLTFALPANATVAIILSAIIRQLRLPARVAQLLRLTRLGGQNVPQNTSIGSLAGRPVRNAYGQMVVQPVTLEVRMPMRGGKGGFGSQLRAAGGKMSAARRNGEENRDSCRDLNGRRLSTVKQARQLAAYMATEDERKRALNEAQKKKLEKLQRMLGRTPRGEAEFVEAAQRLHEEGEDLDEGDVGDAHDDAAEGQGNDKGEGSSRNAVADSKPSSVANAEKGKKRERIDDSEYVEQSRVIVDNVRSAVAAAMMKKKRKANQKSVPKSDSPRSSQPSSAQTVQ